MANNFDIAYKKRLHILILSARLLLLGALCGLGYYFSKGFVSDPLVPVSNNQVSSKLFSGKLQRLEQNLHLFIYSEADMANDVPDDFVYYSAGVFKLGALQGYTRVVAIRPQIGPGSPLVFVLATKDFKTYVLDDPNNNTSRYPSDDWRNPYSVLDKSKIVYTTAFDTEQPKIISLDPNYSLYFEDYPVDTVETLNIDKNGNRVYETLLSENFDNYIKLASPNENLNFFAKPYAYSASNIDSLRQKYLVSNTEVIAVDSTGFPAAYMLTTPNNINEYETQIQNKPDSYVSLPSLGLKRAALLTSLNDSFFNTYEVAIPGACAFTLSTSVFNLHDSDLEPIGTANGIKVYRLVKTNHELYTLAFNNKIGDIYGENKFQWDDVNKSIKQPSLEEYTKSNPLLFVKDYWQRWVGLGEYDIQLPGGCGKPVIYLYPETTTDVTVTFLAPMSFTTAIPTYGDYWKVTAYANGNLVNLRPEITDCTKIDTTKKGSDYAKTACESNIYPYLYWAGNVGLKDYPKMEEGWVVAKTGVTDFIEGKLTEMGLNKKEKEDFMSYWQPEIMSKNATYFKISFLQNNELNMLFPMKVDPTPKTTFRIFLDYTSLAEKPKVLPKPQTLNKLVRNGFTLVEWDGIKK